MSKPKGTIIQCTGPNITTWRVKDQDIFFPRQDVEVDGVKKARGGSHVSNPWGSVGKDYGIPDHGFIRDLPGDAHTIGMRTVFEFSGDNLLGFNQSASVRLETIVTSPDYTSFQHIMSLTLSLNATTPVAHLPAGHPYAIFPEGSTVSLSGKVVTPPRPGDLVAFYELSTLNRSAVITMKGVGVLTITPSAGYISQSPLWALWTDNSEYLAVEFLAGNPEDFKNRKKGQWLKPGQTRKYVCDFAFAPF